MIRFKITALLALSFYCLLENAFACDICSIYNSIEAKRPRAGSIRIEVAEQFTYQGRVQDSSHRVENELHQHLAGSITQLVAGYDFTDHISVQANLPYINRRFKRAEENEVERGTEAGIGDATLIAKYALMHSKKNNTNILLHLFAGIKLPTGDSDRLAEESEEEHHDEENEEHEHLLFARHAGHHHEETPSAVHGHDLALGSGSYDFPIGASIFAERGRAYLSGDIQHIFRTEGDFDYEYADDLIWNIGPAYYLSLGHKHTVAARAAFSGEYKDKDESDEKNEDDTGLRSILFGPEVIVTAWQFSSLLGIDFPLDINNTGFQAVTSYRIRAGLTYRF